MRSYVVIILSTMLLAGCATQRIPFPAAELSALNMAGDKTVNGRIFLIDQFEEEQVGAENTITLEPVSSYSNQWYEVNYLRNKPLKKADPRYEKHVLRTTADSEGKFIFKNVAAGNYYLSGPVSWAATTCSANIVKTEVMISKKISLQGNDTTVNVPLTKEFESPVIICDLYNQGSWEKEDGF